MAQSKAQSLPLKTGYTRELTGLFLFFWACFLVLALISFDKRDPTLNYVHRVVEIHNKAGQFGAYVAGFLNEWFGLCSFLWPLFFIFMGCACLFPKCIPNWRRWIGICLFIPWLMETMAAMNLRSVDFSPSGILGNAIYQFSIRFLNPVGASLVWFFIFLVAIQLMLKLSWSDLFSKIITSKQHGRKCLKHLCKGSLV